MNVVSRNVEDTIYKFLDHDLDAYDVQKFNQFFLVHGYISGKMFMKLRSVVCT